MLLDPRTPLIIGIVLVAVVVGALAFYSPMPGGLSSAHAQLAELETLANCTACHDEAGMATGCLNCHEEIHRQLTQEHGFHHFLLSGTTVECASCHSEHAGGDFQLVNEASWGPQVPAAFRHPHLEFTLVGAHERLACAECHVEHRDESFSLERFDTFERKSSFLGLSQDCRRCHLDAHTEGLTPSCGACHQQEAFLPTGTFQHGDHFPLDGGHEALGCEACHILPKSDIDVAAAGPSKPLPFPFDKVRGENCKDCHESPHRIAFPQECGECHHVSERHWTEAWKGMTPQRHVATGFRLVGAHATVDCVKCHPSELAFSERHPDPSAPGYQRREESCEGCHGDVHGGQFLERYPQCLHCHQRHAFMPPAIGREGHASVFPLNGAHVAVSCRDCHRVEEATAVRKFSGTARQCKGCHPDPHAGQFREHLAAADCSACHLGDSSTFRIRPFDHATRTGYALKGAHALAECGGCHVETPMLVGSEGVTARRYKGTPKACASCHQDVHRGQFASYGECTSCHVSFTDWHLIRFDHNTQSRFPLEGAHAEQSCSRCHVRVRLEDGSQLVRFKPLGTKCGDCHEISPGRGR